MQNWRRPCKKRMHAAARSQRLVVSHGKSRPDRDSVQWRGHCTGRPLMDLRTRTIARSVSDSCVHPRTSNLLRVAKPPLTRASRGGQVHREGLMGGGDVKKRERERKRETDQQVPITLSLQRAQVRSRARTSRRLLRYRWSLSFLSGKHKRP